MMSSPRSDLLGAGKWVLHIIASLSLLVFTLLFYLFPGTRNLDTERAHRRFWKTVAWGLLQFFGIIVPIAIALEASFGFVGYTLYAIALQMLCAVLFNRGHTATVVFEKPIN